MKQIFTTLALLSLAASPALSAGTAPIEGKWQNPKDSVTVEVARCGGAYCGTVVWASAKAKADARKGGTANLVGTRLMTGLKADGRGGYKGRVYLPKHGMHAGAQLRMVGANTLSVKGCAVAGLICKEQRWSRVR